jgi:hypothetical protein
LLFSFVCPSIIDRLIGERQKIIADLCHLERSWPAQRSANAPEPRLREAAARFHDVSVLRL